VAGGPADEAGLRAGTSSQRFQARTVRVGGDIITEVDGRPLEDEAALGVELLRLRPGHRARLRVYRDGKPRNIEVTLGERPQQTDSRVRP